MQYNTNHLIKKLLIFFMLGLLTSNVSALVVIDPPPDKVNELNKIEAWCLMYGGSSNEGYSINKMMAGKTEIIHASTLHNSLALFSYDVIYERIGRGYKKFKDFGYVNGLNRTCIISDGNLYIYNYGDVDTTFIQLDKIEIDVLMTFAQQDDAPEPASPAR